MSSLLAYGQGFLAEDIGSGAGLTEPWAQFCGLGDGDDASVEQEADSGAGGLSQFFSVIQAAAPQQLLEEESPKILSRSSTKKELHWDSPPQSPSGVFVNLPYAVLTIVSKGTGADAVVVGVFQHGSDSVVETLLYIPRGLRFAEYVKFKPDLLRCITGKVFATNELYLPDELTNALGKRPQAFLAHHFSLEKYNGIIFGLWLDGSQVPATSEAVFSNAVQSLPMLLSNRINARKYERLGRRFDAILKVMPDAVLFVDDECAQVVLNPAAATLLGLPSHGEVDPSKVAVAMRTLTDRCIGRTDPQHWMRLLSTDEELEIEEDWELKMPRRVLHVRSYPVSSHAAHGRLWIYEDVTSERDAEKAIEIANRAKSQFLAMMSHELRTPMTGVLGMLDLLHLTNLEEEQQFLARIMQESAEGLMDVINNILDYCKIEAGRLQLEEIDFSLDDMFDQIQAMLKTSFLKKELKLTISGETFGRNVLRGDPVRLRQVLLNLVSNAIKFTEDGSVSVSWRFLHPQWVDTTVVATSQSSSGKSKLINQIINASRGEKCSVEHLTSPTGRSVIIVNCSSAGAAGPYLESSISTSRTPGSSVPFPFTRQHRPGDSSSKNSGVQEMPKQSSGPLIFPVLYSLPPGKPPASEPSQSAEVRHSFTDRKSIVAAQETFRNPISSDAPSQASMTMCDDGQTAPFAQKPLIRDPTSESNEKGFRASKYQRLSVEKHGSNNSLHGQENDELLGLNKTPMWRKDIIAHSPTSSESSLVSIPPQAIDSKVVRRTENSLRTQRTSSALRPREFRSGSISSSQSEDKTGTAATSMDTSELVRSDHANDLHSDQVSVLSYAESREDGDMKEVQPEDKVWLEVTITDTGVGIGKEQLDRLFVGSQAGSQRRNAAGTGLGLAICKGLLCLMNGKIQIDSGIGEGTTVILTVPLLPAAEAAQELLASALVTESASVAEFASATESASVTESSSVTESVTTTALQPTAAPALGSSKPVVAERKAPVPRGSKIKVLVAEDNKVNQLLIRKMFQHLGHQVELVGNGKLAVEAVQRTAFDLVLMDVQMPILDGLSATRAIRCLPPPASKIPIYALSADTPGSGPMEETGLDGYMKKPIAWDMMSALIAQILAAKGEV